jgi:hypothetical protein
MSKNQLPSVDGGKVKQVQQELQTKAEPVKTDTSYTMSDGYRPRRVDVKLTGKHGSILQHKMRKLQDAGAKLADGTEVSDKTKTILWILENEVK